MDWSSVKNYKFDANNLGSAPVPVKIILIVVLMAVIIGLGFYLVTSKQLDDLKQKQQQEQTLKTDFENKYSKSASLEELKKQLVEMEIAFGEMVNQLPSKTEIPGIIEDVSETGLSSGLEIESFKPEAEILKEFYAEKPVRMRVHGGYHELASFASGIANLQRIVTLHDIQITPQREGNELTMEVIAKTYRYTEDDEITDGAATSN